MNAASHLLSPTVPGYGTSDGRCLPCSVISGGSFNISPCSSRSDYKILPKFNVIHLRCGSRGSTLSICYAYSGGKKRNLDYSSRNKQGGDSINRNSRKNEERDDIYDEESDFFSKNGPMISGSPQYQATSTPGRKEKEIVEIFKKIQVRLRERAAHKDVKKVADSPGLKTTNSLINLLRHYVPQGKQSNINGNRSGFDLDQTKENNPALEGKAQTFFGSTKRVKYFAKERFDQPKQNCAVVEDKSHTSLGSENKVIDATQDSKRASWSRPPSNFQRRSPVPQFKYEPIYSDSDSDEETTVNSARLTKINGKRGKTLFEPESKPELDIEPEPEPEPELDLELEQEPKQLAEAESFLSDESGSVSESKFVDLIDDEDSGVDEDAIEDDDDDDDDDDENGDKDLSGMDMQEVRAHVELHLMKVVELRALAKSRGVKGISRLNKQELVELLASSGGSI